MMAGALAGHGTAHSAVSATFCRCCPIFGQLRPQYKCGDRGRAGSCFVRHYKCGSQRWWRTRVKPPQRCALFAAAPCDLPCGSLAQRRPWHCMQEKRGKGPEVHIVLPRGEQNRLRRGTAFLCKIGFKNDLPEVGLPCAIALVHLGARLMWWRCHPGAGANDTAAPAGVCGWALAGTVGLQGCPALHSRQGTAAAATVDASSARCDCSAWVQIPCDPKLILPPFNPQQLAAFKLTELEKASDAWWRGGGARVHAVMECGCRLWWGVDAGRDGMRVDRKSVV